MFDGLYNEFGVVGFDSSPARQILVGYGYDPDNYIATAKLQPSPYVTQSAIQAKIGGLNRLIESVDDSSPPVGSLDPTLPGSNIPNPAYLTYLAVIQNTVTEINGYLTSIYPAPLAQTGTVSVFKVKTVDDNGAVTEVESLDAGNYLDAPVTTGSNLVQSNAMYSSNGIYNVTVVAGTTYQIVFGANDDSAVDSPLSNPIEILNPGTGIPVIYTATTNLIRFLGADISIAVTATLATITANSPAYLRHVDPLANIEYFGNNWQTCQKGSGLSIAAGFASVNYSDESGQLLTAKTQSGNILILDGGTDYKVNEILVFTTGTSFVPAKVRQATLDLICFSLYQRRLAPEEKNPFKDLAKMWREFFTEIGEGNKQLDGTYKRFFSAGQSWNTRSVLNYANSL